MQKILIKILLFILCVSIFGKTLGQTWQHVMADVGINRRDWGIGGGTLGMFNDVTIKITVNTVLK